MIVNCNYFQGPIALSWEPSQQTPTSSLMPLLLTRVMAGVMSKGAPTLSRQLKRWILIFINGKYQSAIFRPSDISSTFTGELQDRRTAQPATSATSYLLMEVPATNTSLQSMRKNPTKEKRNTSSQNLLLKMGAQERSQPRRNGPKSEAEKHSGSFQWVLTDY